MPVTAKLSGKFYERFGDEIANELVDWFNAVDATYQLQLKEVNDLNWTRVEDRLAGMELRFDAKLQALQARFDAKLDAFEARLLSDFDSKLNRLRSELILWMFGFWTATVVPLIGLLLALR